MKDYEAPKRARPLCLLLNHHHLHSHSTKESGTHNPLTDVCAVLLFKKGKPQTTDGYRKGGRLKSVHWGERHKHRAWDCTKLGFGEVPASCHHGKRFLPFYSFATLSNVKIRHTACKNKSKLLFFGADPYGQTSHTSQEARNRKTHFLF